MALQDGKAIMAGRRKKNRQGLWLALLLIILLGMVAVGRSGSGNSPGAEDAGVKASVSSVEQKNSTANNQDTVNSGGVGTDSSPVTLSEIPEYTDSPYVAIRDNLPYFTAQELTADSVETYSSLDALGRCGIAFARVGKDLMPTEPRGSISSVKPTGWHTVKYDIVDGKYLYNRCHLIGYQLTAENANKQNLITGTRYLNVEGMLPFENMVADYVKETGNHVAYRVTPLFDGDNLLASGVVIEGYSIEDKGEGICFNVFAYNIQPGVVIDYANGESHLE